MDNGQTIHKNKNFSADLESIFQHTSSTFLGSVYDIDSMCRWSINILRMGF